MHALEYLILLVAFMRGHYPVGELNDKTSTQAVDLAGWRVSVETKPPSFSMTLPLPDS